MLTHQVDQQKNEIELITGQMRILKEQLKCETDARLESQVNFPLLFSKLTFKSIFLKSKNLQLVTHNRTLLQNIQELLKYINDLETKLGFDSNRELHKILNVNFFFF